MEAERTYTVLELNTVVRDLIKGKFPEYIWVCGEIQGLRPDRDKKHMYFELVQKHSQVHEIIAKVRVALFAGRQEKIFQRIDQAQGAFQLKNDIEVRFLCEVSLHPPTGQYSLIIVDLDPVYTLGKIAQNRQKIIEDLKKKGLLEKNKQRELTALPLNIGLITAFDSAAYHDFINELTVSGYAFKVLAYNSYMQGKNVEKDVVRGLKYFNSLPPDKIDAVFITRGGGSKADLSWFDNKKIAQAVALSGFPVFTALGHHIDVSITDMVACQSFKTPTKGAQFLVDTVRAALDAIEELAQGIMEQATSLVDSENNSLRATALRIDSLVSRYFRDSREDLVEKRLLLVNSFKQLFKDENRRLSNSLTGLTDSANRVLQDSLSGITSIECKVRLLDPKLVLKRGYSIAFKGKKAVKSISQVEKGDKVKTVFFDGYFVSEVEKLGENDE